LLPASSRDSAVGIATSYGLDDRGVGVGVPVESRILSSPNSEPVWTITYRHYFTYIEPVDIVKDLNPLSDTCLKDETGVVVTLRNYIRKVVGLNVGRDTR
jgi:hypothetical protein